MKIRLDTRWRRFVWWLSNGPRTFPCDVCGLPVSRDRGYPGIVHTSNSGARYVHTIHVVRSLRGARPTE